MWSVGADIGQAQDPSAIAVVQEVGQELHLRHLERVPLGTAYAVWTGVGTVGTAALGILLFGESVDALRLGGIALIVVGIATLKLAA